jgi:hypothetical protein
VYKPGYIHPDDVITDIRISVAGVRSCTSEAEQATR